MQFADEESLGLWSEFPALAATFAVIVFGLLPTSLEKLLIRPLRYISTGGFSLNVDDATLLRINNISPAHVLIVSQHYNQALLIEI